MNTNWFFSFIILSITAEVDLLFKDKVKKYRMATMFRPQAPIYLQIFYIKNTMIEGELDLWGGGRDDTSKLVVKFLEIMSHRLSCLQITAKIQTRENPNSQVSTSHVSVFVISGFYYFSTNRMKHGRHLWSNTFVRKRHFSIH